MQIRNYHKILLLSVTAVSLFTGCNNNIEDSPIPVTGDTYILFKSPSGTNIADSLHLSKDSDTEKLDSNDISVSVTRTSDNKTLNSNCHWYDPSLYKYPIYKNEGTALSVSWADFKRERYDTNLIRIKSNKIFGDTITHTIEWFINVGDKINAYKCEVDGIEIDLTNDELYNLSAPRYYFPEAVITIIAK